MNSFNRTLLERRVAGRNARFNPGIVVDRYLCRKCEVNVLVVADSFLYFNDEDFGLSDFVSILESITSPSATVKVRTAHRTNPGAARLNGADANFKFTDAALANVQVVMMFAAATSGPLLSQDELNALAKFMDNGGGVFATGDHEALGRAMCGDLMRVRSMRKWFWPGQGPNGEPVAPHGGNESRHDTNRPGHDGAFEFNDQSDDIPQTITPIYRTVNTTPVGVIKQPHPLLCGPDGVVRVLPDHPHEGECIVPWEMDRSFDYAGQTFAEYPAAANGVQPQPEVIATAHMLPGAETDRKPPIPGGSFGVISAYNGHLAGVGRVACDATWHHFININLTGTDSVGAGDPKSMGFLATPGGEAHFEQIKAYFKNLPIWLAPPATQVCMRNAWIWNTIRLPQLQEEFRFEAMRGSLNELVAVGAAVSLFPSLDASKCQRFQWTLDLVFPELIRPLPEIACMIEPCVRPKGPQPDPVPFMDGERVMHAALGQAALSMARRAHELEAANAPGAPQADEVEALATVAVGDSMRKIGESLNEQLGTMEKMIGEIRRFPS